MNNTLCKVAGESGVKSYLMTSRQNTDVKLAFYEYDGNYYIDLKTELDYQPHNAMT